MLSSSRTDSEVTIAQDDLYQPLQTLPETRDQSVESEPRVEPERQVEPPVEIAEPEIVEPEISEPAKAKSFDHSFSELETQHVKMSTYNPFEELGTKTLYLDLSLLSRNFVYPIRGKFSSGYNVVPANGRVHSGVDLLASQGTPIYAAFSGVVRMSKDYGDYGNVVVIRHTNGLETVYSHNLKNLVEVGEEVECGQEIAQCGRTGNATTNHLHFEVRVAGKTFDPELLIDVESQEMQDGTLEISQTSSGDLRVRLQKSNSSADIGGGDAQTLTPATSRGVKVGDQIYDAPAQSATPAEYHTVRSGDSLWKIAKKYSTTVDNICSLNNISKSATLHVGKKLRVK